MWKPHPIQLFAGWPRAMALLLAIATAMLVAPHSYAEPAAPDTSAVGVHGMVVSESADAARAGVEVLKQGGNAVDAAVTTAVAGRVNDSASCGIRGGRLTRH